MSIDPDIRERLQQMERSLAAQAKSRLQGCDMTYEEYKAEYVRFVEAQRNVARAAREWADAVDDHASAMLEFAEDRTPWATVLSPQKWAAKRAKLAAMRRTHRVLQDEIRVEAHMGADLESISARYAQSCAEGVEP